LLSAIKQEYMLTLSHLHKWTNGKIPMSYCNVKNKDNNKSRLISASNAAPYRTLLKLASKVLTYLLRNLPNDYVQFTLHSIKDLKKEVEQANRLTTIYGNSTGIVSTQS